MRIRRTACRSTVVVATALATMLGTVLPAHADVIAQNSGVRGRADWTWGTQTIYNLRIGVRDLKCDANDVYVILDLDLANGGDIATREYRNSNGCGSARNWSDQTASGVGQQITRIRVFACVDDFGDDTCSTSEYHDNPLVP